MGQQVQNELANASIGASSLIQNVLHTSGSQLLVAQPMQFREGTQDEHGVLEGLQVEQPLTISYVATCQHGHSMIYVGPQIASLGYTQQAWLGKPELRLQHVHEDDLERVMKAMRHSCETGEKFNCRYRMYDSAGRVRWFHDEANMVCDESGEHLFVMGAMRDITDMKEMEEELNEHRYYLEKKVEQRTEELVRRIALLESCNAALCDKLAQARREIAALNRQLGSTPGFEPDACQPMADMGSPRVQVAGMIT